MIGSKIYRITGESMYILQKTGCCFLVDWYRQDGSYAGRRLIDEDVIESWKYFQDNHGIIIPGVGLVPKEGLMP
jgi:hypothetical protein